jgi:antitoxin component YwqK of YwqJK toxin-antitoxin module
MAGKAKPYTHYHKDGTVWAKGQMTDGVMTGYWEWFRKTGTIMRSGHFDPNGRQTSEWITYNAKGKVYKVTQMKPKAPTAKARTPNAKAKASPKRKRRPKKAA